MSLTGGGTPAGMSVILGASQTNILSDVNGLASIVPSVGSFTGALEVEIQVSAGATALLQDQLETFPQASSTGSSGTSPPLTSVADPVFVAPRERNVLSVASEEDR
jgi:hypothetical protein